MTPPPPNSSIMKVFSSSSSIFKSLGSASSWFELFASFSAFSILLRTAINDLIPDQLKSFIASKLKHFFSITFLSSSKDVVTLQITHAWDFQTNLLYLAAKYYLPTKITHSYKSLKVGQLTHNTNIVIAVDGKQEVVDEFEGVKFNWKLLETSKPDSEYNKSSFLLSFDQRHREKVMEEYLPHILKSYENMKLEQRNLKIHYLSSSCDEWKERDLMHPATFETLALDPELKQSIIEDIERFLKRKELYKKVGKPWKRGYLLYGPPGTGKSSLVVAMANYLRFDVYNLELARVASDSDLMKAMTNTCNRSIFVIEDIDCNKEVQPRTLVKEGDDSDDDHSDYGSVYGSPYNSQVLKTFTLSGLLNYMDGLWSSSGDERIIIFTTNHIEKIDPALVRPGRMDMHIHLSFCKSKAFRLLASNYLNIQGHHPLFDQIEVLLETSQVTPALVTEQLLRFEDPHVALQQFLKFLQHRHQHLNHPTTPTS